MNQERARFHLKILHVSDLHERGMQESEGWRRRRVLGSAWEKNLQEILDEGPFDLICFTGDAANSGLADEFKEASEFFTNLLQRLNLERDRLFVIPGNHDIDRRAEKDAWKSVTEAAGVIDPLSFSRWMRGQSAPLGFKNDWRERILQRQATYRSWVRDGLGRPELTPEGSPHGQLGYRVSLTLHKLPFPIHIIGLDTAWLCGKNGEAGLLWLTEDQVMRLATDPNGEPLAGLRLVLLHHPLHDLADGFHCRRLLADSADLLMRGHLHETEMETWADPERNVRQLAAGCLYEVGRADHCPNSFQVITLELSPRGRPLNAEIRLRSWSPRSGHWYDDNSVYGNTRNGRLTWTLASHSNADLQAPNPFDPWTPVYPGNLAGRWEVLRRLEIAAAERRSVTLVGDRRIGKTSVLQTWAEKARQQGLIVVELSGEGPEALSVKDFVTTVTSLPASNIADQAANVLERWATQVSTHDRPPLLLIDEADNLFVRFENRFFERLRGMLGKICLVLVTRREIDHIYQDLGSTSPFHNRLQLLWLGLLEPEAAESLMKRGQRLLSSSDIEQMRLWAGRNPFYLQLLGWHLVEAYLYGGGFAEALDGFRTEAAARLRELWRVLGENDRLALQESVAGIPTMRRRLRNGGLVTEEGLPFGQILAGWVAEELV